VELFFHFPIRLYGVLLKHKITVTFKFMDYHLEVSKQDLIHVMTENVATADETYREYFSD
jgi:hypothetical protein